MLDDKNIKKISKGIVSRYPILYLRSWEENRMEHALSLVSKSD